MQIIVLVQYARSKATYFAARFRDSIFGAGTSNRNLDRQHISRCEIDLGNIKTQYQEEYGVSLASDVAVSYTFQLIDIGSPITFYFKIK